jgi:CMP/dCMP kinase
VPTREGDVAQRQSIVVSGDLGSGKSTVSAMVAHRLGLRRVSVGDLYRRMAEQRGMTALQLNRHAVLDEEVDGYVDRLQREIAGSGEQLVVDSRLAWFFFTDALKVHLMVEPAVAARRVWERPSSRVEVYSSPAEAQRRLRERSESERERFLLRYGADKARLRNYDLVCDTTRANADEAADHVVAAFRGELAPAILRERPPLLLIDPARIHPTRRVGAPQTAGGRPSPGPSLDRPRPGDLEELDLGYAGGRFFVVDGHRRLGAALRQDRRLVPARLVVEGEEPAARRPDGRSSPRDAGPAEAVATG